MKVKEADTTFGLPGQNLHSDKVQQSYNDTCAIKSQELVLHSAGIHLSEDELVQEAIINGWYVPGKGTSIENVGKLMESHGMEVSQIQGASEMNLVSELSKGHPVIVGVDSGELWNPGMEEAMEDVMNCEIADHALIVSGIEYNDDFTEAKVNVIDPGCGGYCQEYDYDTFKDAWEDSDNFMVTFE